MSFELVINPEDQHLGFCQCCGNTTRRVWGYVNDGEATIAAYFVEWTPGHVEKSANFDLILGKWGSGAHPQDKKAVSLAFRHLETGPAFMVLNAVDRSIAKSPLVCEALNRQQVIGAPIAETVFAVCDTVLLEDDRLKPLRTRT